MSLISLLIALIAERYLSSPVWQFKTFYQRYFQFFKKLNIVKSPWQSNVATAIFILVPVLLSHYILNLVDDSLLYFVFSTLLLIVCFGCVSLRATYKKYLLAAFRGDMESADLQHKQLLKQKSLPEMSFGQILIWLNYRYFIAIMLFFVIFGAAGALFYRLLTTVVETSNQAFDENGTIDGSAKEGVTESVDDVAIIVELSEQETDDAQTTVDFEGDDQTTAAKQDVRQTPEQDNSQGT